MAACALASCQASDPVLGSGDTATRNYSPLDQIDRTNVAELAEVWRFDSGEDGGLQTTPLVIGNRLFGYATDQAIFALDAATGELLWRYQPERASGQPARGMAYWSDGEQARIFATSGNYIVALSPESGQPVVSFGEQGRIDLRNNLGRDPGQVAVFPTSAGVVFGDLLILGFRTSESAPAAPGDIRAYDVKTGELRWSFHTIPHPGELGLDTWPADAWQTAGGANSWAGMTVDRERGIVFVPTGSPSFDFFGGDRPGNNLFANSLIALDAKTGKRLWHYQTVHHDLWDRDLPSPPVLLTVTRDGKQRDAVAQTTKHGLVFLFDRETGEPLFDIEERPVPKSTVPGEWTSPTQPFPVKPAPFARQRLDEETITKRTPEAHAAALAQFRKMQSAGQFAPLEVDRDTIVFPGFDGGAEWGGSAAAPGGNVLYVNSNDVPWYMRLVRNEYTPDMGRGEQLYRENCAACHGVDRTGSPPEIPGLIGVGSRLMSYEIMLTIMNGKGRMVGFPQITGTDMQALIDFVTSPAGAPATEPSGEQREVQSPGTASPGAAPYIVTGYNRFVDPDGYPAVTPPWGTLSAIDMSSGEYLWQIPLGEYPELMEAGLPVTGSENYGGPVLTGSGLLFIGATIYDRKMRAFDSSNGKLLWEATLPFAGTATPVTYAANGRQYVVIATSGSRNRNGPQGAAYIAFALPR